MKRTQYAIFVLLLLTSVNLPAVEYRLPNLQGKVISLDQYRGKWLVVNFWATWCEICRKELTDLAALHRDHQGGDIVVVGINYENIETARLQWFVGEYELPYTILKSKPVPVTPLGPVRALPTTYIIDPEGRPVAGEVGLVSQQQIEEYIRSRKAGRVNRTE